MNIQPIEDSALEVLSSDVGLEISNYFARSGKEQIKDVATIITDHGDVGHMKLIIVKEKIDNDNNCD